MEGCLRDAFVRRALCNHLTPHDVLSLRAVSRALKIIFTPACALLSVHFPIPDGVPELEAVRALRFLLFAELPGLEELEALNVFHRLKRAVSMVVQGHVRVISFDGSLHNGAILASIQPSMKNKTWIVRAPVLGRVAQTPSCSCVTG